MSTNFTLDQLAKLLQAELHGDGHCQISSVAALEQATAGQASFVEGVKHIKKLAATEASVVLLTQDLLKQCPTNALVVRRPRLAFAELLQLLYSTRRQPKIGMHSSSIIAENAKIDRSALIGARAVIGNDVCIGRNSIIGAGCSIGDGTVIGDDCHLYPNVSIYPDIKIGSRVIIHSGAVIGADGFGFEPNTDGEWVKLLQIGSVFIGDDVEIGANTTIDRGAITDTIIGKGVKLDNQIMVAHNVTIGEHTIIAGCTAIAGSTKIGRHCIIGGATNITGHIEITDHVIISGAAMVTNSLLKSGTYSSGTGVLPHEQWLRSAVRFRQLDTIYQRLQQLERDSK